MKTPMPIDQLPSFIVKNSVSTEPGINPWLKFIIIGGIIILAVAISKSLTVDVRQNNISSKPEENEYD